MDNSAQLENLLTKSLSQPLNEEEQVLLAAWLKEGEQNRQYYAQLKHTWHLAGMARQGDSDTSGEWKHFRTLLQEEEPEQETAEYEIHNRRGLYKWMLAGAAAASVLLVAGLGWNHWKNTTAADSHRQPAIFAAHYELNKGVRAKQVLLPDGSQVWLEPAAELSWQEPFTHARDIVLKGTARFSVAKDKAKPFAVHSGAIVTEVLGTVFTVQANNKDSVIKVRLYEGSVCVHAGDSGVTTPGNARWCLAPGQQLVFNNNSRAVSITGIPGSNAGTEKAVAPEAGLHKDSPALPAGEKGSWYMFNNQSLAQVFAQLQALYGVEIIYRKQDVQKMYFIGKFSKTDSVETILKQIATLNDLTISIQNNTYTISR